MNIEMIVVMYETAYLIMFILLTEFCLVNNFWEILVL